MLFHRSLACLLALFLALTPGALSADNDERDSQPELDPLGVLSLPQPQGLEFRPKRIVVVTNDGALSTKVPNVVSQLRTNRIDLSDTPYVGQLFDPRPGTRILTPENLVGVAYRDGDALVLDIQRAPLLVGQRNQISVLRRKVRAGVVELMFDTPLTPEAYPGADRMAKLGDVFVEGGRIVIKPQRLDVPRTLIYGSW